MNSKLSATTRQMRLVSDAFDRSDNAVAVMEMIQPGAGSADDLRIASVNGAFCRMTGYSEAELHGRPITMLAAPGTNPQVAARFAAAVVGQTSLRTEMSCMTKSGTAYWFGLHLMPCADADAAASVFVLLGRDITTNRQASEQQKAIQGLLANVFLSVDAAVAIIGADDGRFLMTNPRHDRMLGHKPGALTGTLATDHLAPESKPALQAANDQQQADGKPFTIDLNVLHLDGTELPVRQTSVEVRHRGQRFRIATLTERQAAAIIEPLRVTIAGTIKLVGLDEVRTALGARWPELAERVTTSAEHVMRKRLGPNDTFSRTDDNGFVICFAGMTEDEAAFRAAVIRRDIRTHLIGQGEEPEIARVSTFVASAPVEGDQDGSTQAMHAVLKQRLDLRRGEIEAEARRTLQGAVQSAVCEMEPIHGRAGSGIVARYAHLPAALEARIDAAISVLPGAETITFDQDSLMLGLAADRAMQDALNGETGMVLLNVSFDTFATRPRTERYLGLCANLEPKLRQRLILVLSQVPAAIRQERVLDCVQRLRPFCRSVGFELSDIELPTVDLGPTGVPIISIMADRLTGVGAAAEQKFQKLLAALHLHRGKLLIRRLPSWDAVAHRRLQGVDLVSADPGAGPAP